MKTDFLVEIDEDSLITTLNTGAIPQLDLFVLGPQGPPGESAAEWFIDTDPTMLDVIPGLGVTDGGNTIVVGETTDTVHVPILGSDSKIQQVHIPTYLAPGSVGGGGGTFSGTADSITDGTTKVMFLATERTKLAGIAALATVNATDAALRDRTTHTGTQTSISISDFTEAVQDAVAALLAAGTGVTLAYNDAGNSLTVTSTGSGGITDPEVVRDTIGTALLGVGVISVAINDAADSITISSTATANSTDAALRDRSLHTGSQLASTISDFNTAVAALITSKLNLENNANVNLTANTDVFGAWLVQDDGTDSSVWPNRMTFSFQPVGGAAGGHLTSWFNEYGEFRITPGKSNTIPFRIFGGTAPTDTTARSMTDALIQICDNRTTRVEKFNVYANGNTMIAGTISVAGAATLASAAVTGAITSATVAATGTVTGSNIAQKTRCVPAGTTGFATEPDGTLWIEYTP